MTATDVPGPAGTDSERPALATSRLATEDLTLAYRADRPVVAGLDLSIPSGQVTAIIGANGSGKSTVLKALARLLRPAAGTVLLDGHDIHSMPAGDVARQLGLLPQGPVTPDGITVVELVRRGRLPHTSVFRQWSAADQRAVDCALETTGMIGIAAEQVDSLSGGQRQRAWLALTVAQDTPLLLLDEPTTSLDVAHQLDVLELVRDLHAAGKTVVMVLHDVNQAARYCDHLVVMRGGRVIAAGPPRDVLTSTLLAAAFGVRCRILTDPDSASPLIVPIARLSSRRPSQRPGDERRAGHTERGFT